VLPFAPHRIAIVIADVSGKGMAAALLMSNLQAIVRAFVSSVTSSADLCSKANAMLAGNIAPGKFITFFCAIVDTDRLLIDYCNAGHNPPVLVRRNAAIERLTAGGPILGIFPGIAFVGGAVSLFAGDTLVLFTDGITEAEDAAGEEFGETRLIDVLHGVQASGAQAIRQGIVDAVRNFAGTSLQDDATFIVLTAPASA